MKLNNSKSKRDAQYTSLKILDVLFTLGCWSFYVRSVRNINYTYFSQRSGRKWQICNLMFFSYIIYIRIYMSTNIIIKYP